MLITNHPDDERLAALASGDAEVADDRELVEHASACDRCSALVRELRVLLASLADLPDLAPSRPLRLVPPVTDEPVTDSLGAWVRRLFGPVVMAGATLAFVGLIGTTNGLSGMTQTIFSNVGNQLDGGGAAPAAEVDEDTQDARASARIDTLASEWAYPGEDPTIGDAAQDRAPAERSLWPMVLFTGVAMVVGAALLRWILVPRAG